MKQIPNLFTLLNLVFGCIAIVFILQVGQSMVTLNDESGTIDAVFPEKLALGGLFIFFAAVIDFLDGFLARAMKAQSEMGKQLDSLSDVVSFGVAPGLILYQLLRLGYAQQENGLQVSIAALLPAFIFTAAVAWRLAKFNLSTDQTHSFRGIPSPAAGLVIASFPLIIWNQYYNIQNYFINVWVLYAVILLLSCLMLTNRRFMAVKFKDFSFQNNAQKYILIILSIICIALLKWFSVPVIFVLYLLVSLFTKVPSPPVNNSKQTLDVTV